MKQLILFNLLFYSFVSFGQNSESIQLKKVYKESDFLPQIEGVFTGEIDVVKLGSSSGIVNKVAWKIISFTLSYPSGRDFKTVKINSNQIPEDIIKELVKSALKEQIYFTEIIAIDELNVKHQLKSMVLIPIPNDEK